MNDPDDAEALVRSRTDPTAFRVVFEHYYSPIHGYLRRRVGANDADELTSETFVRAFQWRARYDVASGTPRAWLFGIATNVARDHWRREERRLRAYARSCFAPVEAGADEADARADAQRLHGALALALGSLPRRQRDVLLLHAWADLSDAEIAAVLGIPTGTVRSRLSRARARLREQLPSTGEDQGERPRRRVPGDG